MWLPRPVWDVIDGLERAGHVAVAVGGCVRDALMGRVPGDYDVATSAVPDQVKAALPGVRSVDTGLKHGTVTLLMGGMAIEVTTFRVDGAYLDHRRPDGVRFTRSLAEDVRRRDFTVNALCYGRGGLIDLVGGQQDIAGRRIRCVGDPTARFNEDALRILRALRFSAQLDFIVEPATAAAAVAGRHLLAHVSGERIRAELLKLLAGPAAQSALTAFRAVMEAAFPALSPLSPDEYATACRAAAALGGRPAAALAALFYQASDWRAALNRLKLDGATHRRAAALIRASDWPLPGDRPAARRLAAALGLPAGADLIALRTALGDETAQAAKLLAEVARDGDAVTIKQLQIGGRDLQALGLVGPAVGGALHSLLDRVIDGELPNERGALIAAAREGAWKG